MLQDLPLFSRRTSINFKVLTLVSSVLNAVAIKSAVHPRRTMARQEIWIRRKGGATASALRYFCSRFLRETRAATAVEFALIAMPFLGTVLVGLSMGVVFFLNVSLDRAVGKAARSMLTGAIRSNQISASQYKSTVFCPMLPSSFDCSKVIINVFVERPAAQTATTNGYADLANANLTALLTTAYTDTTSAKFCTGSPGDYVYLQVLYPLPALVSFLSPTGSVATVNGAPAFLLDSTSAFRNEQFPSGSSGC